MATNSPMRLDAELTEAARATAGSMSRSLSQQNAHWARIGRELERSPGVTAPTVQAVLDGRGGYDQLNVQEQAIVRANWAEGIENTRKSLRLDRILAAQGREVVERDAQGEVTVRKPRAVSLVLPKRRFVPLLHLLAGPNGSGKTTFKAYVLQPVTGLPFMNDDVVAREHQTSIGRYEDPPDLRDPRGQNRVALSLRRRLSRIASPGSVAPPHDAAICNTL